MSLDPSAARPTAVVIVNPQGRPTSRHDWRTTVTAVLERRFQVDLLYPRDPDESTALARSAAAKGAHVVIAAGGDGTINAIARGLAGGNVPLGILPTGTANDLASELGIPRDLAAAAERIVAGTPRRIDLLAVNGAVYCTVGGLVLVAQTTLFVSRLKSVAAPLRRAADAMGGGVYRLAATVNLLGRRRLCERMRIEYTDAGDGACRTIDADVHALFVANHHTLGGGLVLPVSTRADDGVFELCLVPRRSRLSLAMNFARLSSGAPIPPGVITVLRATHAVVHTERAQPFVADGELLSTGRSFEIAIHPRALGVIA